MPKANFTDFLDDIGHFVKLFEAAGGHVSDLRRVNPDVASQLVAIVQHSKRILREPEEPLPALEDLNLDVRLVRILERIGVTTTEQLLDTTELQMRITPGIGPQRVAEIVEALRRQRLELKSFRVDEKKVENAMEPADSLLLIA